METHVFDLRGPHGLFRKPYAPVSPVSFPVPPPPTIMGMIGAICGYGKREYLERVGWDQVKISVAVKEPVKRLRTGINLLNTKDGITKDDAFFSTDPNRIQIPHEFLKDVHIRVYVADGPTEMMDDLGTRLEEGTTAYTVSLGLAQCLASIEHIATVEAEPVEGRLEVDSIIPQDAVSRIEYAEDGRYGHYRLPHRMRPDRKVTEYTAVVVDEQGQPTTVDTTEARRIGDENVLFL